MGRTRHEVSCIREGEIIQLVEQSHLPAKRTLDKLGIPRATFYRWYDRYCPSSDDLRLVRRFEKGGSGSSGLKFKRHTAGAASGGLRWLQA